MEDGHSRKLQAILRLNVQLFSVSEIRSTCFLGASANEKAMSIIKHPRNKTSKNFPSKFFCMVRIYVHLHTTRILVTHVQELYLVVDSSLAISSEKDCS
jgi:hypothetical protein